MTGNFNQRRVPRTAAAFGFGLLCVCATVTPAQTNDAMSQRIQRLERALDNKGLLDLVQQVELLQQEVRQLRGELENQIFALEQQRRSQRQGYVDIDQRLGTLEQGGIISIAPQPAATQGAGSVPQITLDPPLATLDVDSDNSIAGRPSDQEIAVDIQTRSAPREPRPADAGAAGAAGSGSIAALAPFPAARPDAPTAVVTLPGPPPRAGVPTIDSAESEAAYDAAFTMLQAGQYEDAIAAFNSYVQQYPASQHADNAEHWLGEAYYVNGQYEPAIEHYQRVIQNYPGSEKRPHALLKIGYSYDALGLTEQAVRVLSDLKNQFPGSAAARAAGQRLQQVRAAAR